MPTQLPKKTPVNETAPQTRAGTHPLQLTSRVALEIINSLSAHIAILDQNGKIMATNTAWADFARTNRIQMRPDTVDVNYLEICDNAMGDADDGAGQVSKGIRDLIEKKIDEFSMEYPCHSPHEKRWFYMRATRTSDSAPLRIVITHENITPLKEAQEELRRQHTELERQKQGLAESNTALKVILNQRNNEKTEVEGNLISNMKELVLPYVEKLKDAKLTVEEKAYLNIIQSQLNNIVSPLIRKLSSEYLNLSPQEIRVASFVKEGKSTKEISQCMFISESTVNFHRKRIREKLGLKHKRTNMRSYLLSLEE